MTERLVGPDLIVRINVHYEKLGRIFVHLFSKSFMKYTFIPI